jgi:hypothetical protein
LFKGLCALLALVVPSTVAALSDGSGLRRCVDGAFTGPVGHAPAHVTQTAFLLKGDAQVFSQTFRAKQCLAFLVAGARNVQSLELVVRSQEGRVLGRSTTPSVLAHVRHCGDEGELVFVTVRVTDGQGEVLFGAWPAGQLQAETLRRLEACPAVGSPRPAPMFVGPEPGGQTIEHQLDMMGTDLGRLGYHAGRLVAFGGLRSGQHATNGLILTRDRCYALLAVGSDEIADLDLRVFGPTLPLTVSGMDVSRSRVALVKLCAQAPARYVMDVAAYQGEGTYAVAALELEEPGAAPGIEGEARIEYAELVARMRARGFEPEVLTSVVVARDEKLQLPLPLSGDSCIAVGVLRSDHDDEAAGLVLGLAASDGRLLAMDGPAREPPLLFHCATQPEQLRALVGTVQGHGQVHFAVVVGRELSEGPR